MSTFMDHIHRGDDPVLPDIAHCPACGQPIDYCPGHGMVGDPCGYEALTRHDEGDHAICHPNGCEDAPFYGGCGVKGCRDCRPLFDEANNPIPGTDGDGS